jgi:hypothetical protein
MSFQNPADIPGLTEFIQDQVAAFLGRAGYTDSSGTFSLTSLLLEDAVTNGTTSKAPTSNAAYDAIATAQAAATAAAVAQTITNGVTTSAPSQDAVFDALALKLDAASGAHAVTIATLDGQASKPAAPSAGFYKLYAKDDGKLYILDSADSETLVGSQS